MMMGTPRGVITGWRNSISLINSVVIDSGIWTKFIFKDLDQTFSVINVYGPYEDRQIF
jgi:hypothetical protein